MAALHLGVVALAAIMAIGTLETAALQLNKPVAKIPTHCPAVDPEDHVVMLGHEVMCDLFYMCHEGQKIVTVCPAENKKGDVLHFDPELQSCQWRNLAKCKNPQCNLKKDMNGNPIKLAYGGSCTNYYDCEDGLLVVKVCPKGENFDYNLRQCRKSLEANCRPIENCKSIRKEPVEDNCSYYSTCLASKKVILPCPAGKYFSRALQDCVDKRDSDCGQHTPCSGNGKMPDPTDCTKYTQCVNGFVETKSCGSGLHFNPFAHVCENPRDAGCDTTRPCHAYFPYHISPTTCMGNGRSPNKCNCDLYKECENGIVVDRTCPEGTHFNKHAQECMEPCKAFCNSNLNCGVTSPAPITMTSTTSTPTTQSPTTPSPTTPSPTTPSPTTPLPTTPSPTTQSPTTLSPTTPSPTTPSPTTLSPTTPSPTTRSPTTPIPTTPSPNNCTGPHRSPYYCNCTLYKECQNGIDVLLECPSGLHFNPIKLVCEDPCEAGCDLNLDCRVRDPPKRDCSGNEKAPVCGDCSAYTICENGMSVLKECPAGLHFNPYAHKCMDPSIAGCERCDCCPQPTPPPPECTGPYNATDKCGDCHTYRKCHNHTIVTRWCPSDMHFNPFALECQPECDAHCKDVNCPTKPPPKECKCSGNVKVAVPSNCNSYKVCEDGVVRTKMCPYGLHFNQFAAECQPPCEACCDKDWDCSPTPTPSEPIDCIGYGRKPHPTNCHVYMECWEGVIKEFHCPNELDFNPFAQECQPIELAGCDDRTTCKPECHGCELSSHECDCRLYYECHGGKKELRSCGRKHFNPVSKKCEHPEDAGCNLSIPAIIGECVGDFRVPHEEICTSYYECEDGVKIPQDCPTGKAFSTYDQACVDAEDPNSECQLDA